MNIVVMTKITVLAIIAIVAAAPIVLTTELSEATSVLAQVMDNNTEDATTMGNLTGGNATTGAGNTTEGNMTDLAGEISGRSKKSCNELC